MLPHEKHNSTFPPHHQSTTAPQNFPGPTPTPVDLRKEILDQSRPCGRNPPRLGGLRPQIAQQELRPFVVRPATRPLPFAISALLFASSYSSVPVRTSVCLHCLTHERS